MAKTYDSYKDSGIAWIGEIPEGWKTNRLKYLCSIATGNKDTQDSEEDGIYKFYVRSPIIEHSNSWTFEGEGILMAGDGAGAGRVFHHAFGKYAVHQRVYRMADFKSINTNFLYYYLSSLFCRIMDMGSAQSTVPSVRLPMLTNFVVCIPPLSEQQSIASFLDTKCGEIDSLISLQEEMISELQAYKQSVITEAVTKGLDPNAKMNCCASREKNDACISSSETQPAIERKFKDSGVEWIGEIPEGWKVSPLKYIIKGHLQYGANESGVLYEEGLPRYVRITDILDNKLREDIQKQSLTEQQAEGFILKNNDILFARSGGTVGKSFIYKSEYGRCAFAGYLIKASINDDNDAEFVYFFTQSSAYDEWKRRIFIQATIQNIGADKYSQLEIPLPFKEMQTKIVSFLKDKTSQIDSLISLKQQKIDELKSYKKSIIYEYVTGKKRV